MSAENLEGLTTNCGWKVFEKVTSKQHSGGNFCVRYFVKNNAGEIAFLKAMDFSRAFAKPDRMTALYELTSEYRFESFILELCKDAKMTKVVIPLSSGVIKVDGKMPPWDEVYFIIFEKAESDLRQAFINSAPNTWYSFFRAIKHTCIGLEQLHRAKIAHQDIKPSNILNFNNEISKIADMGRVVDEAGTSPFAKYRFAGDQNYAPIEIHHDIKVANFSERYLTDLNGVGSLIYQTFMNVHITAALISEAYRISPALGTMSYYLALPIYETAFFTLMDRLHQECALRFDADIASSVVSAVSEMCHPDYRKRGAPKLNSIKARASLRRYSSKIDSILRQLKIKDFM
jgi:serine/threonine protein kinase